MTQGGPGVDLAMREIKRRLQEDGLDPACSEEHKVKHLWQLYLKSEASLKASLESIEELRAQQSEEMKEVENYVEHIRSLSNEREALTLEFEAENEQLKTEIEKLHVELEGLRNNTEIKEMLSQQGLEEIAIGNTSEQIAYLLVERARLMDELEAEQSRGVVDTPEGTMTAQQVWSVLEQERMDFEEELEEQRNSVKVTKERMKQGHEEEVNSLMSDNQQLQDMLDQAKTKTVKWEEEVSRLRSELEEQQTKYEELQRHSSQQTNLIGSEGTNQNLEISRVQDHVQELEADNQTLRENMKKVTLELQQERDNIAVILNEQEKNLQNIHKQAQADKILISQCQTENERLVAEKQYLETQLGQMEKRLEAAAQGRDLHTQDTNRMEEDSETAEAEVSIKKELDDIKDENNHLQHELSTTKLQLKRERERLSGSETQSSSLQESADQQNKIRSLERKVSSLEGDLANAQRELWAKQTEYKKVLRSSPNPFSRQGSFNDFGRRGGSFHEARGQSRLHSSHSIDNIHNPNLHSIQSIDSVHSPKSIRDMEEKLASLEDELKQTKARLENVTTEKQDLEQQVEEITHQRVALEGQLTQSTAQLEMLEQATQQMESDNKELSAKLTEAFAQFENVQEQLQVEQHKNASSDQNSEETLTKAYHDLDHLRSEVRRLKVELSQRENELILLRQETQTQKTKSEDQTVVLQSEMESVQVQHQVELESFSQKLERSYQENQDLKHKLSDRDEELIRINSKVSKLENSKTLLESQLTSEQGYRNDLENRNKKLEEEVQKACDQVREFTRKVSSLERSNEHLKQDLERKDQIQRDTEMLVNQKTANQDTVLHFAQSRTESAEKRVSVLQKDLEEALSRLQTAEQKLKVTSATEQQLQAHKDEVTKLRSKLHNEQLQKSLVSQSSEDLTQQLMELRGRERDLQRRNNELQHMLLDVQAQLEQMKDTTRAASNNRQTDPSKSVISEQVSTMHRDMEQLQLQLAIATEKYDQQCRRYSDRKLRTKSKLQKARELFNQEKSKFRNEIDRLQGELAMAKAALNREVEWKSQLEAKYKEMMMDKRKLLTQLTEQEEQVRDHSRTLSVLQVRTKYLEEENGNLQMRIDSVTRQKHNLDRLIKDFQLERHREGEDNVDNNGTSTPVELHRALSPDMSALVSPRTHTFTSSGLGYSASSTLDHQQYLDAIISPRVRSPDDDLGSFTKLSNTYAGLRSSYENLDSDPINM